MCLKEEVLLCNSSILHILRKLITMPVRQGYDSKGGFYQWGPKVHYTPGDEKSRKKALEKLHKTVYAIKKKSGQV